MSTQSSTQASTQSSTQASTQTSTQTPTFQNPVAQAVPFALPSWTELLQIAQSHTPVRRVRRPGQSPSTAPISGSLANLAPGEKLTLTLGTGGQQG